jgi:hypothetical protein
VISPTAVLSFPNISSARSIDHPLLLPQTGGPAQLPRWQLRNLKIQQLEHPQPYISSVPSEKVLRRINFQISKNDIEHIITATPDSIERVLRVMKDKIQQYLEKSKERQEEIEQLKGETDKNM